MTTPNRRRALKTRVTQFLIAVDQLINTLAGGWADETMSSRAYRCQATKPHWARTRKIIDAIFFWQPSHCMAAYEAEVERLQSPPAQRIEIQLRAD